MALDFRKLQIKSIQAPNFLMSPLELHEYIDFEVKRVYFITHPTGPTGSHAHKVEKELFVIVQGTCVAEIDQGNGLEDVPMGDTGTHAIYVGTQIWHHFKDFSADAIVMALSSTNYDPSREDYIMDYTEYQKTIAGMK